MKKLLLLFALFVPVWGYAQGTAEWGERVHGVIRKINVGDDSKKLVALTLDLCGGDKTGNALDKDLAGYLQKNNIKATIFVSKRFIDKNEREFLNLAKSKNFDIQNHGTEHRPASITGREIYGIRGFKSKDELKSELLKNEKHVEKLTGKRMMLYRSGTAYYEPAAVKIIHDMGYKVIGFSINGDHGATDSAKAVEKNFMGAKSGDIIIGHLNRPDTDVGAGMISAIEKLRAQGVEFVFVRDYIGE